jgi:CRP/FNR family cyclic AMP-dependent transcriptional regulator
MKTILVIEDNLYIRENTAELLALENYNVLTADNGKSGYESALKNKPDVIICDVMMPVTDGAGFLELVKNEKAISQTPLIFFSAASAPMDEYRNYIYLKKPFDNEDLLGAVGKALIQVK